jgi:Protein of unknown function (DUF1579).
MSDDNAQAQQGPRPDPALKRLEKFIGTWEMKGRTLNSKEDNVLGRATFEWLPGGFFLQQRIELNFMGMQLRSLELVGYDLQTQTFASNVYSNMSPMPLPYKWDVQDDSLTISVAYGPLDATFKGKFSKDGKSFSGGWRPNPGADETINVPYDIEGTRVS